MTAGASACTMVRNSGLSFGEALVSMTTTGFSIEALIERKESTKREVTSVVAGDRR